MEGCAYVGTASGGLRRVHWTQRWQRRLRKSDDKITPPSKAAPRPRRPQAGRRRSSTPSRTLPAKARPPFQLPKHIAPRPKWAAGHLNPLGPLENPHSNMYKHSIPEPEGPSAADPPDLSDGAPEPQAHKAKAQEKLPTEASTSPRADIAVPENDSDCAKPCLAYMKERSSSSNTQTRTVAPSVPRLSPLTRTCTKGLLFCALCMDVLSEAACTSNFRGPHMVHNGPPAESWMSLSLGLSPIYGQVMPASSETRTSSNSPFLENQGMQVRSEPTSPPYWGFESF